MALSYFNRNVSYETLKVGTLDLLINNVTLEAIPLLEIFVSASKKKFKSSSILNYFNDHFVNMTEDNLYEYLEKAIKLVHRIDVELDNSFLYFLYLLQIPREILSHIKKLLIRPFNKYMTSSFSPRTNIHKTIKLLWDSLKRESINKSLESLNIEESIQYYILLIEETYYYGDDDAIELSIQNIVNETLEEAAEIYSENGRYDLFFINYTNGVHPDTRGILKEYLGIVNSNDRLPNFILHNYIIICGDIFIVHDPLLDILPETIKDELLNNNSTYDSHLGIERSNDMKLLLRNVYCNFIHESIGIDSCSIIYQRELILLLIDLRLIYKYVRLNQPYGLENTSSGIELNDFIEETNITKLLYYINNYVINNKSLLDYTDELWVKIKLLRKRGYYNYNKEAIKLYKIMVEFTKHG